MHRDRQRVRLYMNYTACDDVQFAGLMWAHRAGLTGANIQLCRIRQSKQDIIELMELKLFAANLLSKLTWRKQVNWRIEQDYSGIRQTLRQRDVSVALIKPLKSFQYWRDRQELLWEELKSNTSQTLRMCCRGINSSSQSWPLLTVCAAYQSVWRSESLSIQGWRFKLHSKS